MTIDTACPVVDASGAHTPISLPAKTSPSTIPLHWPFRKVETANSRQLGITKAAEVSLFCAKAISLFIVAAAPRAMPRKNFNIDAPNAQRCANSLASISPSGLQRNRGRIRRGDRSNANRYAVALCLNVAHCPFASTAFHKLATKQSEVDGVTAPLWRWSKSMTPDFVDGILAALMPSQLMVAWLLWRVT
jgi:hypothetical protein